MSRARRTILAWLAPVMLAGACGGRSNLTLGDADAGSAGSSGHGGGGRGGTSGQGGASGRGGFAGMSGSAGISGSAGMGGSGGGNGECVPSPHFDCQFCHCKSCSALWANCHNDPGCGEITDCLAATGCRGVSCLQPGGCADVIDRWGGPGSASSSRALELDICAADAGCSCGSGVGGTGGTGFGGTGFGGTTSTGCAECIQMLCPDAWQCLAVPSPCRDGTRCAISQCGGIDWRADCALMCFRGDPALARQARTALECVGQRCSGQCTMSTEPIGRN